MDKVTGNCLKHFLLLRQGQLNLHHLQNMFLLNLHLHTWFLTLLVFSLYILISSSSGNLLSYIRFLTSLFLFSIFPQKRLQSRHLLNEVLFTAKLQAEFFISCVYQNVDRYPLRIPGDFISYFNSSFYCTPFAVAVVLIPGCKICDAHYVCYSVCT